MTLLSREEIADIRDRARGARATGESEILADDIDRLFADLAASPPLVVIAAEGASEQGIRRIIRGLAAVNRGPVYVLHHGWAEATEEQRDALIGRMRSIARNAREECAALVDGMADVYEAPEIAKSIRALNEGTA